MRRLAGTVVWTSQQGWPELLIRLDEPGAAAVAAREEPVRQTWMTARFPVP